MQDGSRGDHARDVALGREVLESLKRNGYRGCIVRSERVNELRASIEGRYRDGLLDKEFYETNLQSFDFDLPRELPGASCLIPVAIPQPQIRFLFNLNGKRVPAIVPPTYLGFEEAEKRARRIIMSVLGAEGYRAIPAPLPKKLLSVQGGLARYGKNNITYVPGMGSFYRLAAFYSDLPCHEDEWRRPEMMERCESCSACAHQCPTGAIDTDRFLLHAEKCIVYLNEKPYGVPFPDWVDPAWHNCLVGCMLCQRACPENRHLVDWVENGAEFSEEETRLLLDVNPLEALESPSRLPAPLMEKLKETHLFWGLETLPRNLRALMEAE